MSEDLSRWLLSRFYSFFTSLRVSEQSGEQRWRKRKRRSSRVEWSMCRNNTHDSWLFQVEPPDAVVARRICIHGLIDLALD